MADGTTAASSPQIRLPWDDAVEQLLSSGWMHVSEAVGGDLVERLADEDRRQWRLLGDEGVVRQHAFGSYLPLETARTAVRRVADGLVAGLSGAAQQRGLPSFNEVAWSRYPEAPAASPSTLTLLTTAAWSRSSRSEAPRPSGSSAPTPKWPSGRPVRASWLCFEERDGLTKPVAAPSTRSILHPRENG
jgi:hypothetical protein